MVERRRRLKVLPQPVERKRKPFLYEERRKQEEPEEPVFRFVGPYRRHIGRRTLIHALADEYEFGNSISRLYVSLLVRAVLEQEPQLLRKPNNAKHPHTQRDITRCGITLKAREREGYVVCETDS
jgi:hypothetical protein